MRGGRGQALLELALCAPVILALGLGTVAAVQVFDAQSGLQAASDTAVAAAARAPDAGTAATAANRAFESVAASYPLQAAMVTLDVSEFARGSSVTAESSAIVSIAGESIAFLPARIALRARATAVIEPYRSRP